MEIIKCGAIGLALLFSANQSWAIDAQSTVVALRLAGTITGGSMPTSDPLFPQMVAQVAAGNVKGAAQLAANSPYFAKYLARRLAFEMQNPNLDASIVTDSDATAFLIAHFAGASGSVKPSISTIWSENATYLVNVNVNGTATPTHAAALTASQLATLDWTSGLSATSGQMAKTVTNGTATPVAIPSKHVGGYVTLSDRGGDNSFAMYGATAGTNLRMIEGMWEIATGLTLIDFASAMAPAQNAPRFVPEYDPNFFHGQGQTACIACHGGGPSSLNHGYSTVADLFDYDPKNGLVFISAPTVNTQKSLGSDPKKRAAVAQCNLARQPGTVCNPDSAGADPNQAWDVMATWGSTGLLERLGWNGPKSGQGLNELGTALGQANIVYQFLVQRVVGEICPMGSFTTEQVNQIAAAANPAQGGSDDIRTIVALVASDSSCL